MLDIVDQHQTVGLSVLRHIRQFIIDRVLDRIQLNLSSVYLNMTGLKIQYRPGFTRVVS